MAQATEATQIHLKPAQKRALLARARANNTSVPEEVRRAINAYLTGVTPDELVLLDQASRHAQTLLTQMAQTLEGTNVRLRQVFAERERLRAGR